MPRDPLNRRDFLRLCLLTAASAGLGGCGGRSPISATGPTLVPTLPPGSRVRLVTRGDVWTWQKKVVARLAGGADCQRLAIRANGSELPAALGSGPGRMPAFSASIPLTEGQNELVAICTRPDGQEEFSQMNTIQQKLRDVPKAIIAISLNNGLVVLDGAGSKPAEHAAAEIATYSWSAREGNPEALKLPVSSAQIEVPMPRADGEYYLKLEVTDAAGRADASTIYF